MGEPFNYCPRCGAPVSLRVPAGDDRPRHVCGACGTVHYQNPKLVAGCLAEWGERILLCRRAIEPRRGLWTLPAGFMENGETTQEAAMREALEEANARVEILALYSLIDLPHIDQVYCLFRSRLLDLGFSPGHETLEVQLFEEAEIPWESLAFASIVRTLRHYFEDRRRGEFRLLTGTVRPPP
jgi:ADP-ribose pyrophosphatase YjhB (NUDIX family)